MPTESGVYVICVGGQGTAKSPINHMVVFDVASLFDRKGEL